MIRQFESYDRAIHAAAIARRILPDAGHVYVTNENRGWETVIVSPFQNKLSPMGSAHLMVVPPPETLVAHILRSFKEGICAFGHYMALSAESSIYFGIMGPPMVVGSDDEMAKRSR